MKLLTTVNIIHAQNANQHDSVDAEVRRMMFVEIVALESSTECTAAQASFGGPDLFI